jgi:nucleoside-diphosphate-sugar epimerase
MKSRSLSITGATGFVGWHVAEGFRHAGWRVRAIVRPGSVKPVPDGVDAVEAPLAGAALVAAVQGSDLLIHSAGVIRAPTEAGFHAVNVDGTRAAVYAANQACARFVLISSQAAIGPGTVERPSLEDDQPWPVNAYGRSKLAAERVVRETARIPWTILRPCAVYGPRDRGFLPLFRLAKRGLFFFPAAPTTSFTFIDVEDLVRCVVLAASEERALGETLFVGHAEPKTADDLLRALAHTSSRRYHPRSISPAIVHGFAVLGDLAWKLGQKPVIDTGRLAELRSEGFVCSVDRARALIGFTARVSVQVGIERTAQWYRANGWL